MKEGFFTLLLIGLLTLILWAGVALVWKPEAAAPWRSAGIDSAQAEQTENRRPEKNRKKNRTKPATPVRSNEQYLALNSVPAAATITTAGTSSSTVLSNKLSNDQNSFENQQVKSDEHQFNVTINYHDPVCLELFGHSVSVKILFNNGTAALKSRSISELEAIVQIYHQCREQRIVVSFPAQDPAGLQGGLLNASSDILAGNLHPSLRQRREDEVKYFLMHMRVDRDRIRLPDQL